MIPPILSRRGFLFGAALSGLPPLPLTRLASAEGAPFAEGLLDIFLTGTTLPAPAFADAARTVPLPNPVRADAAGLLPAIFLDPATAYRLRARTSTGAAIAGMDFDPVPGTGASGALFRQDDRHAVARSADAKLADFVNVLDFHADSDGNDLTRALQHALYHAFPSRPRLELRLPPGVWTVGECLVVPRPVSIRGAGMLETILDFSRADRPNPRMRAAIAFGLASTLAAYDRDYAGKVQGPSLHAANGGSDFSQISDLAIKVANPAIPYGIWTAARLTCSDMVVNGGGFQWCAGELLHGSGTIAGNANICHFRNCHSIGAAEHGFFADGTDANAGNLIGCNAFTPRGIGFYDASFLGNNYIGCHGSGGTTTFKVRLGVGANKSIFTGCYAEAANGTEWDVPAPAMILGPTGALPASVASNANPCLASQGVHGLITGAALSFLSDLNDPSFGSAAAPAARMFRGGAFIRGQGGAGDIYQFVSSGQQLGGGTGGGEGASIVKRGGVSGIDYNLIWFGDPRHRPAFPRGLVATLPTFADNAAALRGGLTEGDVYKTEDGAVRIVV